MTFGGIKGGKAKDPAGRNRQHPASPPNRRARRRKEAEERQRLYNAMTTEQKLAQSIKLGGKDSRQSLRLQKKLDERLAKQSDPGRPSAAKPPVKPKARK